MLGGAPGRLRCWKKRVDIANDFKTGRVGTGDNGRLCNRMGSLMVQPLLKP